ncbi:MAG TPA: Calx-beta domain-containing protein [Chitinophagaceae bacterium]
MKKFRLFLLLAIPVILLTGFKNITNPNLRFQGIDISIGNSIIVEGNSGQRSVEVFIILSQPAAVPVTVNYNTENGTATGGSDYVAANGTVSFNPGERMKKITILVNGDVACEGNETFKIVLSTPTGASLSITTGTVTIVNDDCISLPTYEIRLTYKGYTTFYTGPPDCPIRTNGEVLLTGLVSGNEKVDPDDDITYTGNLQLDIDMDICSVIRVGGEDKFCGMTVIGSGLVDTELKLYFNGLGQDSARGGYIKFEDKSGNFLKKVFGTCDAAEMTEEQTMVPDKTIASIFNGSELPMLKNRTLRIGRYVLTGDAGETVVEVLRKIR